MAEMSEDVFARIAADFGSAARPRAQELLAAYDTGPWLVDADRVRLAVLDIARGDLAELEAALAEARMDWRNVLYWSETINPYLDSTGRERPRLSDSNPDP